jgi:Na+/H+ antiporter NhaA
MELEELKSAWAQYDKKLSQNLKLNEELLRKMNLEKSKKEMNAPLTYEIISVSIGVIFLLYIAFATIRYSNEFKFLLPGIITCIIVAIWVYNSFSKIRLLSNIDYYYTPIVELQKSIHTFNQKYQKYKKFELYSIPVFAISAMPILGIALRNFDIYEHLTRFIIGIVLSLILGYPGTIWIYKNLYDKKLRNTTKFLDELSQFEKEE